MPSAARTSTSKVCAPVRWAWPYRAVVTRVEHVHALDGEREQRRLVAHERGRRLHGAVQDRRREQVARLDRTQGRQRVVRAGAQRGDAAECVRVGDAARGELGVEVVDVDPLRALRPEVGEVDRLAARRLVGRDRGRARLAGAEFEAVVGSGRP